ncbi:MAG: polyprenyl synthetase family protein [Candidatus Dormibacteria bacterium]
MISESAQVARRAGRHLELAEGAQAVLGRFQKQVQGGLEEAVAGLPEEMREPARYHLGLLPGARFGKALRPTLTMLLAEGLEAPEGHSLPLAAAVQLVHDFSLLHDDIVDGDRSRRGRPALWVRDGVPTALNAGDALLTAAFCVIGGAELPSAIRARATRRLSRATLEMVGGQQADIAATGTPPDDLGQYLDMVDRKTGALMGAAAALGAIAANAAGPTVEACQRFGRTLGVAFQLRDDMLGVFGDSQETGKPVGNDLLRGKQGLPLVLALGSNGGLGRTVRGWLEPGGLPDSELAPAVALLEERGVAERCQGLTTTWTERALAAAAKLPLLPQTAEELEVLGRWLGERWS